MTTLEELRIVSQVRPTINTEKPVLNDFHDKLRYARQDGSLPLYWNLCSAAIRHMVIEGILSLYAVGAATFLLFPDAARAMPVGLLLPLLLIPSLVVGATAVGVGVAWAWSLLAFVHYSLREVRSLASRESPSVAYDPLPLGKSEWEEFLRRYSRRVLVFNCIGVVCYVVLGFLIPYNIYYVPGAYAALGGLLFPNTPIWDSINVFGAMVSGVVGVGLNIAAYYRLMRVDWSRSVPALANMAVQEDSFRAMLNQVLWYTITYTVIGVVLFYSLMNADYQAVSKVSGPSLTISFEWLAALGTSLILLAVGNVHQSFPVEGDSTGAHPTLQLTPAQPRLEDQAPTRRTTEPAGERRLYLLGTGAALPKAVVTVEEIKTSVKSTLSPIEWKNLYQEGDYFDKCNLIEKRVLAADEGLGLLMVTAAAEAIKKAKISVDSIDLVICASGGVPGFTGWLWSSVVCEKLGIKNARCRDISGTCAGALLALESAFAQFNTNRSIRNILIIGADKFSTLTTAANMRVYASVPTWGDGAATMVLGEDASTQPFKLYLSRVTSFQRSEFSRMLRLESSNGQLSAQRSEEAALELGPIARGWHDLNRRTMLEIADELYPPGSSLPAHLVIGNTASDRAELLRKDRWGHVSVTESFSMHGHMGAADPLFNLNTLLSTLSVEGKGERESRISTQGIAVFGWGGGYTWAGARFDGG